MLGYFACIHLTGSSLVERIELGCCPRAQGNLPKPGRAGLYIGFTTLDFKHGMRLVHDKVTEAGSRNHRSRDQLLLYALYHHWN